MADNQLCYTTSEIFHLRTCLFNTCLPGCPPLFTFLIKKDARNHENPLGLKIEPSACYLRGHLKMHCTAMAMQGTVPSIYSSRLLMCQNTLASHKYTAFGNGPDIGISVYCKSAECYLTCADSPPCVEWSTQPLMKCSLSIY